MRSSDLRRGNCYEIGLFEGSEVWRTAETCSRNALENDVRMCSIVKFCTLFEIQRGSPRFAGDDRKSYKKRSNEREREPSHVVFA